MPDLLFGGDGIDTAVFTGNLADYTINVFAGTVTDNIAARDGTDTLSSVEFLQFADQTVAFQPSPIAVDDVDATGPSGNLVIDVLANDTDSGGTPLTSGDLTAPTTISPAPGSGLALTLDDGSILYVANDGSSGLDSFDYTITTAEGTDSAEVAVVAQAATGLPETSFINGSAADETLTGTATNNTLFGLGGDDVLYTLAGNDTADAGAGDDILVADGGDNQLTGGTGTDLFVLTHESVGVNNFEIVSDLSQGEGDLLLLAIEGLTQDDGSIDADRVSLLSFGSDSFLLADLNDDLPGDGMESVLARLDGVDSSVDPSAVLAAILANDLII